MRLRAGAPDALAAAGAGRVADRPALPGVPPGAGARWCRRRPVRRLDEVLRAGRGVIERHLAEIERIEREQQVQSFVSALRAGAILPEDFGRPR